MKALALVATLVIGLLLFYGTRDFSPWGDPDSPPNRHISPVYIEKSVEQTHVPNVVTSVLGDYRGYDTMFETTVIFCAGMAVVAVLRKRKEKPS